MASGRSLRRALPANVSSCYEKTRGQSLVTLPGLCGRLRPKSSDHQSGLKEFINVNFGLAKYRAQCPFGHIAGMMRNEDNPTAFGMTLDFVRAFAL